ncbi:hypothetical protein [Pimelobacter simplex]|uniref:hypothetical protein n=1 Tax=Nocardioides simplex TaxID=2045 RepID=UPI0019327611|nr:hypothetical protein [Pimelobacter simplex]
MKNRTHRLATGLLATAAAASTVVAMTATAAQAATTYTPTGGLSASFVGTSVSFTDIEAAQTLTCTTFDLSGSIISSGSSRPYGADGGTLGSLSSSGCTNPLAGATTVTPVGTWTVAVTGDATGTSWPAQLKNVKATVSAANCTFGVTGVVNGRFDDSNQRFTPASGASGLTIDGGAGAPTGSMCVTLDLQPGDTIAVGGYWTNTPPTGSAALDISNP